MEKLRSNPYRKSACPTLPRFQEIVNFQTLIKSDKNMISFREFGSFKLLLFLENSVMFLECLKNNSKILSDVIIMQFGKGVLHSLRVQLRINFHSTRGAVSKITNNHVISINYIMENITQQYKI